MQLRLLTSALLVAVLTGLGPSTAEAGPPRTAKEFAAAGTAQKYQDDFLRYTTFRVDSVSDHGGYMVVDASATRDTKVRGVTTTTRYTVRFYIEVAAPPRGQTVGQMKVTSAKATQIR